MGKTSRYRYRARARARAGTRTRTTSAMTTSTCMSNFKITQANSIIIYKYTENAYTI
jgi:hypothetical protein